MCWGSFLNVVAYRIIHDYNIARPRSFCPSCKQTLAWYDLIPVISWIILCGKCRTCKTAISWLYPFIETLTTISMTALVMLVPVNYIPAYFIFFSALIVTTRTDTETLLISRLATLFLIPLGLLFSVLKFLPITPLESILGTAVGYLFLYIFAKIFYLLTGKVGIGSGDFELLAFIGAFTGFIGCWLSLVIGSVLGTTFATIQILLGKSDRSTKIAFGAFLSIAAIIFVLFQKQLLKCFLGLA